MRKQLVAGLVLAGALSGFAVGQVGSFLTGVARAKPGEMTVVAQKAVDDFDWKRLSASSAAQVSQVANEASLVLQFALVKQNDEIIRLLRKLAGE